MIVALVTVFPVPGGPWMRLNGFCSTLFTALICEPFSSGRPGTENLRGSLALHWCSGNFVSKQSVEDVPAHAHLVQCEGLHGKLHTVEGSSFPHVVCS